MARKQPDTQGSTRRPWFKQYPLTVAKASVLKHVSPTVLPRWPADRHVSASHLYSHYYQIRGHYATFDDEKRQSSSLRKRGPRLPIRPLKYTFTRREAPVVRAYPPPMWTKPRSLNAEFLPRSKRCVSSEDRNFLISHELTRNRVKRKGLVSHSLLCQEIIPALRRQVLELPASHGRIYEDCA